MATACGSDAAVQATEQDNVAIGAPSDGESGEAPPENPNPVEDSDGSEDYPDVTETEAVHSDTVTDPEPDEEHGDDGAVDPEGDVPHDDFLHDPAAPGVLMIAEEAVGEEVGATMALDADTSLPVLTVDYGTASAEIAFTLPHYDIGGAKLTLANGDVIDLSEPSLGYPSTAVTLEAPIPGSDSDWARFATSFLAGTTSFDIDGNRAIITGRIGTNTIAQIQHLVDEHPEVDTLVLAQIDGAVEDHIEATFGRVDPWRFTQLASDLIREHGFTTVIPVDGRVTDRGLLLFAGGEERIVESTEGAFHEQQVGELSVRAECCGLTADDADSDVFYDQYSAVHEADVQRWSSLLGEEAGTALALHLAQQSIGGPHQLSRVELDAFNLVTTPAALSTATDFAPIADDPALGSLDLNITVSRPEELLDAIAKAFNAAQADVEEGREVATPWVVTHGDTTLGYLLIEGGLDDAVRGQLSALVLEGDDSFGWVATDVSNRYLCSRGLSDGLCI